jgi:AraC-like DNA-binding protein
MKLILPDYYGSCLIIIRYICEIVCGILMVDVSYVVVLAVVVSFLALFVVIIMLIRTTRKVVDNTNMLLKREADSAAASPVDMIKQDLSSMSQPSKMDDTQLMAWMDAKMDELSLYQNPDLDLKTASEAMGISQRRIVRLLKSQPQYGTFAVYLTEKRLAKACLMLKSHPQYTIEAICLDSGFRSRRTFQTLFKTRLGVSPSEYRSAVRNN